MKKIYNFAGVLWASISIVLLAREGFDLGTLNGPFLSIVTFFDSAMSFLFSPIKPYASNFGKWVFGLFGFQIELNEYWKYFFTLVLLYSGAQVSHAWGAGHKQFAIFRFIAGVLIGFIGASLVGAIPAELAQSIILTPILIGATIALYQIFNNFWIGLIWRDKELNTFWPGFRFSMKYPIYYICIGIIVGIIGALSESLTLNNLSKNPVIFSLITYVVLFVGFWFALGLVHTLKENGNDSFAKRLKRQGPTVLGWQMLQAIIGATLFSLANAGWTLVESL